MRRASLAEREARKDAMLRLLDRRPLVLIGMMGAGKTTVGRRIAARLGRRFVDSDEEIEKAANMSIEEMFSELGEPEFRSGEARVIARLLREGEMVLATGGGAFINPETRALVKADGLSVWLKADVDVLFARVSRRSNRPLLKTENPRETLKTLVNARYPIYAEADVTVYSRDVSQDMVADEVISAVLNHLEAQEGDRNE
jgi:shikimate kinase